MKALGDLSHHPRLKSPRKDLIKVYHDTLEKNIPYPNHRRMPNMVVRGLYHIGYFFADFGPMLVNLFNVVYTNIRKLFGFFVNLLIELSTIVILLATITFSIFHSIELLRDAGATNGLEYVGLLIFEVLFVSTTAGLTKSLMQKKDPNWFHVAGFAAGIAFVLASNITGMAQNWTGWIIGSAIPLMLIISEGTLAYQYMEDEKKKTRTEFHIDLLKKLTEQEIMEIKSYLETYQLTAQSGTKTSSEMVEILVENDHQNGTESGTGKSKKMVDEMDQTTDRIDTKNGHGLGGKMVSELVENPVQNGAENGYEMVENLVGDTPQNGNQNDTKTGRENGTDSDEKLVENLVEKQTDENDETSDISADDADEAEPKIEPKSNPKMNQNVGEEMVDEVVENSVENETKICPEVDQETEPKLDQETNQKDAKNGSKDDTKNGNENSTEMDKEQEPIITADADPKVIQKVRRRVNRWVKKEYVGKKPPGRKKISNEFDVDDKLARQFAAELKEKYKDKVS